MPNVIYSKLKCTYHINSTVTVIFGVMDLLKIVLIIRYASRYSAFQ